MSESVAKRLTRIGRSYPMANTPRIGAVRGLLLSELEATTISRALVWYAGLLVVFIGLSALVYERRTAP
jgi:hypothetical protein